MTSGHPENYTALTEVTEFSENPMVDKLAA